MKQPNLWGEHNRALREHPEYQMLGLLDCLREELMMNMPIMPEIKDTPQREHIHYHFRLPEPKRKNKSKYD